MTPEILKIREEFVDRIRCFFKERRILEVSTPCLRNYTVTDNNVHSLFVDGEFGKGYLQTSPEYAMKILLSNGSGPIFQLAPCFRDDPAGALHRREFLILEWYRPNYDYHELMDEVASLVQELLGRKVTRSKYWTVMKRFAGIDPDSDFQSCATKLASLNLSRKTLSTLQLDDLLDLIFTQHVLTRLDGCFIYDYPASQCALARIRPGYPAVAERFELFIDGVEIGNGYHELTDRDSHLERFARDQRERACRGQPIPEIDKDFISALEHGLPDCSGVALGIDRLFMLSQGQDSLDGLCW